MDDTPDNQHNEAVMLFDLTQFKRALARDLESLLNTRTMENAELLESYPLAKSSMGLSQLRKQLGEAQALDENLFIYYAGLLSQKPLSAATLTALVQGFFEVEAKLEQFVGQWIAVPETEQTGLGSQACELGLSAFVGGRIWDRQTKMRLRLGPMRLAKFEAMQPGSTGALALKALLQFALGHSLALEVQLVLDCRDIPAPIVSLGSQLRLGGNLWIGAPEAQLSHPDDMRYALLQ